MVQWTVFVSHSCLDFAFIDMQIMCKWEGKKKMQFLLYTNG